MSVQLKCELPDFVDTSLLTYGQTIKIEKYFLWASQNNVVNECSILYEIANTPQNPEGLVNILQYIDENSERLSDWSASNKAANDLYAVSIALQSDPSILHEDSLQIEKPANLLLRGYLNTSYLLALILTVPTQTTYSYKNSFNGIRLWVLIESYKRGLSFNYLDKLMLDVCTQLRLTKNGQGEIFKFVLNLYKDHSDFDSVTTLLGMQANVLLKRGVTINVEKFLKTLIKITKGDHSPFDTNEAIISYNRFVSNKPWHLQPKPEVQVVRPDIDEPQHNVFGVNDDQDNLTEIEQDLSEPFHLRKLSSHSIFLASAEQSQYLPWSWHSLNQFELTVLEKEIDRLLISDEPDKNFAGSILWIGWKLGRSVHRVLDFLITQEVHGEWSFCPDKKCLHRLPPRRKGSWLPTQADQSWIKSSVQFNFFSLPHQVLRPIVDRLTTGEHFERVVDLWTSSKNSNPIEYIKNELLDPLPRFTPGILNLVFGYQLFYQSKDYKFTKTVSSLPNTGLPPACAYASWSSLTPLAIQFALQTNESESYQNNNEIILFGSALNPLDNKLIEQIKLAGKKLESIRREENLLKFHNAFSIYLHVMLLAATGARPINDVFESITHFDFNEHFVFIDDKTDAIGNKGRLVPIPEMLSSYLYVEYKAHLRILANKLSEKNPEISAEILNILSGKRSEKLPFLFLLSTDDLCGWKSITPTEIRQSKLLETPLPLNLFRHRLPKYLADKDVEPEIIDGLMGHIEYGSETYGKYSERVWLNDIEQLRVVINAAFESLDFPYIKHQPTLILKSDINRGLNQEKISYGYSARALQRSSQSRATIKVVRAEIQTFLNGRAFYDLSEDELNILSKQMVFSALGTPRQDAFLRYRYFEHKVERVVHATGKDIKLKKRYISPAPENPFTSDAANAILKIQKIRKIIAQHLREMSLTNLQLKLCGLYAKLLLIFENRLTDENKLEQILTDGSFKLIEIKGSYYLEILATENENTSPVQRMKISTSLTVILSKLKGSRSKIKNNSFENYPNSTIECLQAIQEVLEASNDHDYVALFKLNIRLMNQFNYMTMPGIVAGYLSGQNQSWSLSLFDFVKLHTGTHVALPDIEHTKLLEDTNHVKDEVPQVIAGSEKHLNAMDAKAFLQDIRNLLKAYDNDSTQFSSMRDFASLLEKKIESYRHKVSSSLIILAEWGKQLVEGYKRHKKESYATSSIVRYFNALSNKFEKFAIQNNILAMDEDELTEFYTQLLLDANKISRYYIAQRLYDFHKWASIKFALEEPDWDELPEVIKGVNVRPGFISETEYQQVLTTLLHSHEDKAYARSMAFFMLLVYRFGLRSMEALGLMREDIGQYQDKLVLLIQNNSIRKLKNKYSRRQVPLLFRWSKTEQRIFEEYMDYQGASFGYETVTPLFFDQRNTFNLSQIAYFKSNVIRILKQVTGNPMTNIHHARHSAANQVAYKLHGLNLTAWKKLKNNINADLKVDLLGLDHETTRRSSWASARFLGHTGRATQYKNYIHFLGDWADDFHDPFDSRFKIFKSKNILSISALPLINPPALKVKVFPKQPLEEPTINTLFRALVLLSNGKSVDAVCAITFMALGTINLLREFVVQISNKLRALVVIENGGMAIMNKISRSGLERIYDLTYKTDARVKEKNFALTQLNKLPIDELISLVGMNGHLLMYQEHHFNLIRSMLDIFEIDDDLFQVYKSNKSANNFNQVVEKNRFQIKNPMSLRSGTAIQLDPVWDHNTGFHVEARSALIFEKNSVGFVRNRYELLILFAIFVVLIDNK